MPIIKRRHHANACITLIAPLHATLIKPVKPTPQKPMLHHRPANILKTLARLWPAAMLIPFRMLWQGKNSLYFRHPLATTSGEIRVGRFTEIGAHAYINAGPNGVKIGSYSQINALTAIVGNVSIGDRVLIAPGCTIVAGGHRFGKNIQPRFSGSSVEKSIFVGDDVWIGAGVNIVGSVNIGNGSVIAAGVAIDRDVPPGTLVRRGSFSAVFEPIH